MKPTDPLGPEPSPAAPLSRRRVLGTAAWSVPAITVASAAPAFASSASDEVRLSLVSQEWLENYLYVQLKVENLSSVATATNTAVTLVFQGAWRDGALVDIDPITGGVNGSWGVGWTASTTSQGLSSSTRVLTLPQLAPGSESIVGFRVRRQGLASRTPYGAPVGSQITSVGPGFEVSSDSLTGFIANPEPNAVALRGSCGVLSLIGPGFTLTAGNVAVPAGTTITVTREGVLEAGVLPIIWDGSNAQAPGLATINALGESTYSVTLAEDLPAGQSLHVRYLLAINLLARETAVLTPPAGSTFPAGAKTTGEFNSTLVVCFSN